MGESSWCPSKHRSQNLAVPEQLLPRSGDSAEHRHGPCQVGLGLYLRLWPKHPANLCCPAALFLSTVPCPTQGRFGSVREPALPVCSHCFAFQMLGGKKNGHPAVARLAV